MITPINTLRDKNYHLLFENQCAFIYKKLSLLLKQNALCQVCMVEIEIGKFCQCIFRYFVFIFSRKECGSSFEQTWIPFTQGSFGSCLVEIYLVFFFVVVKIGLLVLEKKSKKWKVYIETDRQTDKRSENLKHSAQVS